MSDVSIFGKKWIDLVFEGKNKSYGAYQLRQESPRTTLAAFLFGILFLGSLCGGGFLLSSFGDKPVVPTDPIYELPTVTTVNVSPSEPPKPKAPKTASAPVTTDVNKKNLNNPRVVTSADDPVDVKPNTDNTAATTTEPGSTTGTEGSATSTTPVTTTSGTGTNPNAAEGIVRKGSLDVQPRFPGGLERFYEYVGDNFEKSDTETGRKLTVVVSFVIEKDGSLSDIKVIQNPGEGLDKEAIRVLKSLRTKWKPGMINGQPVRTAYSLPIAVMK
ncbi:MAG TPA: energy transducer TonB [Flavobacterium sp.]|jgi:protein TonB